MTYLYRVVIEQVDEDTAAADLNAVWTPSEEYPHWSQYIEDIKASSPGR
jgi:hypothetical protein